MARRTSPRLCYVAPTVAHFVCSLPPEGAANSLGAARRGFSPHGRSLRVLPRPPRGRKFPWGGPAGIQPPRSLTACAPCPPRGPQIPLGRPGGNSAPTVAHFVCSLPPEGAANS